MKERPTPETDAFADRLDSAKVPKVTREKHWYDHACDLERKLGEAREFIVAVSGACAEALSERNEARREAEKWREYWMQDRTMSMVPNTSLPWEKRP